MSRRRPSEYADDPEGFCEDVLEITLFDKAREILRAVRDYHDVAVKGCHESGKTFISAAIMHWWLCTNVDSIVITTAPKEELVEKLIWRDFKDQLNHCRFWLYPQSANRTELTIDSKWYAVGMTARSENAAFFQGFHTRGRVLYIIDEGSGVEPIFFDARTRITPNPDDRFLVIGNPYPANTEFHACFRSRFFKTITISAFDVPNVCERRVVIPGLLRHEAVERWEHEFGKDSIFWKTRVDADFYEEGDVGLIPLSWFDLAVARWKRLKDKEHAGRKTLGVDVAAEGKDKSIIAPMIGNFIDTLIVFANPDTTALAHRCETYCNQSYLPIVDTIGVGAGVTSTLRHDGYAVFAYKGSQRTDAKDRSGELAFANVRSHAYWQLREALDPANAEAVALPDDPELREDLVGLKYREVTGGRIQVEEKAQVVKRLGRSPDKGDAVVMANYGQRRGVSVGKVDNEQSRITRDELQADAMTRIYGDPHYSTW